MSISIVRRVFAYSLILSALILSACNPTPTPAPTPKTGSFPPPGATAVPPPSSDFPTGPGTVDAYIRAPGTLHSPDFHQPDGSEIRNCQAQFIEWHGISNARFFDVQIDDNSDFSSPTVNQSVGTGDFIPPEPSQQFPFEDYRTSYTFGTLYYYHVRARNNGGAAPYGPAHSFRWPSPPPVAPVIAAPADGQVLGTGGNFHWTYAPGAGDPFEGDCFHIQISTTPDMFSLMHEMTFFSPDRHYALPAVAFTPDIPYYWRLAGCNNAGPAVPTCGPWTKIQSFIFKNTGSVQGGVYSDFDHDSDASDPGEGPISGVLVTIIDCGPAQTQTTGPDGLFHFSNLPAGTCHVTVGAPGWVFDGTFPPGIGVPPAAASDPSLPTSFSIFMVAAGPKGPPAPTKVPPTPTGGPVTPLSFEWSIASWRVNPSNANEYFGIMKIVPHGGNPPYQFFFDDQPQPGDQFEYVAAKCRSRPTTLSVKSADGQQARQVISLIAPYCPVTPTETPRKP
jgi:hypothetical protein